jgi:hypothetical protein
MQPGGGELSKMLNMAETVDAAIEVYYERSIVNLNSRVDSFC